MRNNRQWIFLAAGLALLGAAISFLTYGYVRRLELNDTGATRLIILSLLADSLPHTVEHATDSDLMLEAQKVAEHELVAAIWLVDASGTIVYHHGGRGSVGANVESLITPHYRDFLESLPQGSFSPEQEVQLLTAAALRSEGGHNDVFDHYVMPVRGEKGQLSAMVAVSYAVSPAVGVPPLAMAILPSLGLTLFAAYWVGIVVWVYGDAQLRGENAMLWAGLALMTNIVGLTAYSLAVDEGGTRVMNFIRWLDDKMWHATVAYPDHFYERLGKYTKASDEVLDIRWERRRFSSDVVFVHLARPLDTERIRAISQDISILMDEGWLDMTFLFQKDTVDHFVLMKGKDYVPNPKLNREA